MSSKTTTRVAEEEKKTRTASPAKDTKKRSKVTDESKVPEVVPEKSDSSNKEQNEKNKASAKKDKNQKTEEVKEKEPKEAAKPSEKAVNASKSEKKEKISVKDAETKEKEKVTENKEITKIPEVKEKGIKESEVKECKDKANVCEEQKNVDIPKSKDEEKASTSENKEQKKNDPEPKSNVPKPKSDVPEPKSNAPEPKSNGSGAKLNGSKVNGSGSKGHGSEPANGHNGDTMETIDLDNDDDCVMSGPEQDNDEHFPELSYDDTSDNDGFEPSTPEFLGVNRSLTRRSQAKSTATPETPKSLSRVATAEPRSDSASTLSSAEEEAPKIQKAKEETNSMRLRSSDVSTINEKSDEIQSQSELNAANLMKTDTNFSKSRIKISPYRRGARPLDSASMIVNYTGSTTTLDDSFNLSNVSDKSSDILESDSSQMSSLRAIKGRRSYKELREVTLRSVTLQKIRDKAKEANKAKMESLAAAVPADTSSVPIAQVVGRKRRTSHTQDESQRDADVAEVAAKRARLLQRVVVSPFTNLMSRGRNVLASSTPLTQRRIVQQVVVESYSDLHGSDDIKTNAENDIIVDSQDDSARAQIDLEVGQSALGAEGERKRCSIM